MKPLLTLLLVLFGFTLFANDTLTRQEIYDFAVNDTFDYRMDRYSAETHGGITDVNIDTSYLTRYVVTGFFYSADSTTKYIERLIVTSVPVKYDTIKLNPPTGNEVELSFQQLVYGDSAFISGQPLFFNQPVNTTYERRGYTWIAKKYARGLGKVYENSSGGVMGYSFNNTNALIYYSGSRGVMGTPYTDYPLSVNNVSSTGNLSVYVTPGGNLHVAVENNNRLPFMFRVYDVSGRLLAGTTVTTTVDDIGLENLSSGMYIWQAVFKDNTTLSGKIVRP